MSRALILVCCWLTACGRASGPNPEERRSEAEADVQAASTALGPWFEEVAAAAGVLFGHTSGHRDRFYMPEINAGGVALLDFDQDGLLDLFCVNGGSVDPEATHAPGHRLYRNLGHWRFEDVTDTAGVGSSRGYGMGAASGDMDNDGWTDLYVLNLRTNILYRNLGNGKFEDVTARAGVGGNEWSSSAAFFDFDRDGDLDLFVVNYIHWSAAAEVACYSRGGVEDYCSPLSYRAPAQDRFFRNRGDGTFEDASAEVGLPKAYGNGLGVATADVDRDGWVDVFVANDATPNQLWMNREGRSFEDQALLRGCALNAIGVARAGMGAVAIDLGGRGWLDLFVTHLVGEGNGLFHNTHGYFADLIAPRGPTSGSWPYTGFGVGFRDFDHDGNLDLFVANGRVRLGARDLDPEDPYAEPNTLLRGLGDAQFVEVTPAGGTDPPLLGASRGAAFGDLDNDGAEDLVVINKDGPIHVLRNVVGHRGNWIGLIVRGTSGQVACNAVLRIETPGGQVFWRQVQPNEGYASSNDPRVVIGIGSAPSASVEVNWLDGSRNAHGPLAAGAYHVVQQPP
jgi:hypothetical protein